MRILFSLFSLGAACYGLWWMASTQPVVKNKIEELLSTGSFHTLEVRYTANQVMDAHRKELLKDNRHRFLEPSLKFYPYLLLEVKYATSATKTKEGVILWDLTDGEMVLETKKWAKTHGFGDCIHAGTTHQEFRVINALAQKGGSSDKEVLAKFLCIDRTMLDIWLDSCRRKQLIVQSGNHYRLHIEHPSLPSFPVTQLDERLVTKSHHHTERLHPYFSVSQIEKIAKAAFGNDFAIRKTLDVYLPVHCIVVQNPDGSIQSSHWNALNGKRLPSHFIN